MNLLRRVKAELSTSQRLIVLVRETQAVVQEAPQAYADAVIFNSSLGTGKGDFVQALQTLSEGGVYLPKEIRQLGACQVPNPNLPPLIEELTERELRWWRGGPRSHQPGHRQQPRRLGGNGEDPRSERQRQVGCRESHPIGGDGVALRSGRSSRLIPAG